MDVFRTGKSTEPEETAGSGGGGFGKWLRDHLGGAMGSKTSSQTSSPTVCRSQSEKYVARPAHATQNVYCSLPREHANAKHYRKCEPGHHRDKSLPFLARGVSVYSSEGKGSKSRNRERRRHSMNEPQTRRRR